MDDKSFYYSQNALSTYTSCQLKFRRRYIDGLYWPRPTNDQIELGQNFHILCERYFTIGQYRCDKELHRWMELLSQFRPMTAEFTFLPEQELRYNADGLRLVAKYDLLAFSAEEQVIIYDWKTEERQMRRPYAERIFQTVVYRFLLAKAGSSYWKRLIKPSDIVMIYWNPRFPDAPITLGYSNRQYKHDENQICQLIAEIESKHEDDFWPTTEEMVCRRCEYAPLCRKDTTAVPVYREEEDISLRWDDILEI